MENPIARVTLTRRIQLYRSLQVFEKKFNHSLSTRVIPTTLIVAPILQIFCTYVLIKLSHRLPSQGYLTYPFAIFTCSKVCIIFETFAAQLFVNSEKLYADWKKEPGLLKVNRRRLRSLQPMRMKVGSNFIDRGTALVTQDFCINQTVSLLLL